MQRTQIYLTDDEQAAIRQISIRSGSSQSALIRKAIDQYIAQNATGTRPRSTISWPPTTGTSASKRMNAFGIWQDHDSPPSLTELRAEERFTE